MWNGPLCILKILIVIFSKLAFVPSKRFRKNGIVLRKEEYIAWFIFIQGKVYRITTYRPFRFIFDDSNYFRSNISDNLWLIPAPMMNCNMHGSKNAWAWAYANCDDSIMSLRFSNDLNEIMLYSYIYNIIKCFIFMGGRESLHTIFYCLYWQIHKSSILNPEENVASL